MKRILIVLGTRPEAVKMAPVIRALKDNKNTFETIVCDTGQHRDMVDHILRLFSINLDIRLKIMVPNQTLHHITIEALRNMKEVFAENQPDIVLVQGDTTTASATGLAAFYNKVMLGHIEAGLRTGHKFSPFPEEINRRLISVLTDYHFAPTQTARDALLREGVAPERIWVTGNTVIDAVEHIKNLVCNPGYKLPIRDYLIEKHKWADGDSIIVVTCHRRESFGVELVEICKTIRYLAAKHPNILFAYPVHFNPNVRGPVYDLLSNIKNIALLEPQPYDAFLWLMSRSRLLLTDSGGVQEEAYVFRKPVLIMRKVTERTEAIASGYAWLVGTRQQDIAAKVKEILLALEKGTNFFCLPNPFGDGNAAFRIVQALSRKL